MLLNRPHSHAHAFADALWISAGRFGQPLLGAAALLGIVAMMQDARRADAWAATVTVAVVGWLAVMFARRRM